MSLEHCRIIHNDIQDQLVLSLKPPLFNFFKDLFLIADKKCKRSKQPDKILETIQNELTNLKKIKKDRLEKLMLEARKIDINFDELAYNAVQFRIEIYEKYFNTQLRNKNIFNLNNFMKRIILFIARKIYKEPYILGNDTNINIRQNNYLKLNTIIINSIYEIINQYVPFRDILKKLPLASIKKCV
jgi:hypothetical protein